MLEENQLQICREAVETLRSYPYDHPYRKIRMEYADRIEMQILVGNPKHDDTCVSLSQSIIKAAASEAVDGCTCPDIMQTGLYYGGDVCEYCKLSSDTEVPF